MNAVLQPMAQLPAESFQGMIGQDPSMLILFDRIQRAARQAMPILIVGETGTGKELVARALHALSDHSGPLMPLNVATLSEELAEGELFGTVRGAFTGAVDRPGMIEASSGGTLFLDEASELSLPTQARLLRTLESQTVRRVGGHHERHVRFRLLLSLQRPARALVEAGRWREDFCYRVEGITLQVPPLRDRQQDIIPLINHTLSRYGFPALGAGDGDQLRQYSWPGNVRELLRVVERAVFAASGNVVSGRHLEAELGHGCFSAGASIPPISVARQSAERAYIESVLRSTGNAKAAASLAGLSTHQLYRRLRSLGIAPPSRR